MRQQPQGRAKDLVNGIIWRWLHCRCAQSCRFRNETCLKHALTNTTQPLVLCRNLQMLDAILSVLIYLHQKAIGNGAQMLEDATGNTCSSYPRNHHLASFCQVLPTLSSARQSGTVECSLVTYMTTQTKTTSAGGGSYRSVQLAESKLLQSLETCPGKYGTAQLRGWPPSNPPPRTLPPSRSCNKQGSFHRRRLRLSVPTTL